MLTAGNPIHENAHMAYRVVIERLEFQGRCGVAPTERRRPQPLAIDVQLDCEGTPSEASDQIGKTVDYAQIAERIVELGETHDCALLETFSEKVLEMLFTEFPVAKVSLWLRKLAPPLSHMTGSVGVKVERSRIAQQPQQTHPAPSLFLAQQLQLHRLPKGRALDVAAGSGRHALYLASHGFQVDAIDRDEQAMVQLAATAKQRNLPNLTVHTVDLERKTAERPEFPKQQYDVIVVFFYLHRALFPALIDSLKPNGVLLYETFTIDNYLRHHHPRRWEFCLAHNELLRLTSTLRVLSYDEGEHDGGYGPGSVFTARLAAQQAGLSSLSYK
ncbi:MAG: dihydroneopterin aldolase [Nitrospiraceae bacterium]|nr:MAG: dihydroneopterin aldolase [Nitrospiraceae bacterium]